MVQRPARGEYQQRFRERVHRLVEHEFAQTLGQRTLHTQDIYGTAWFDGLTVAQVPRVTLTSDALGAPRVVVTGGRGVAPACEHGSLPDRPSRGTHGP